MSDSCKFHSQAQGLCYRNNRPTDSAASPQQQTGGGGVFVKSTRSSEQINTNK